MRTMDDDMLDGILLEDVVVSDTMDTTDDEDPAVLNFLVVLRSFIGPFVLTVSSSFAIRNGAAVVWLLSLSIGLFYLIRRMSIVEAIIVAVVYIPLMTWIFLFVIATVPSGFHIVI